MTINSFVLVFSLHSWHPCKYNVVLKEVFASRRDSVLGSLFLCRDFHPHMLPTLSTPTALKIGRIPHSALCFLMKSVGHKPVRASGVLFFFMSCLPPSFVISCWVLFHDLVRAVDLFHPAGFFLCSFVLCRKTSGFRDQKMLLRPRISSLFRMPSSTRPAWFMT